MRPDAAPVTLDVGSLEPILVRHGVVVAWLFGSQAEGTAGPDSDIDVAVLFWPGSSWLSGEQLASDLRALLGVPVDVVDLASAPLELRGKVVQTGRLLFSADEPRRVRFVTETRSRWFDFAPFQRRLTEAYLQRVAARGFDRGRP